MKTAIDSLSRIEAAKILAPDVRVGDVLVLNPKKFHRTNATTAKHILAVKFLASGTSGLASPMQVPGMLWKETSFFNEILKSAIEWSDFTEGVRQLLNTEEGRKALSAGFFPEKLSLYRKMVAEL
jgi:hypothetical protein